MKKLFVSILSALMILSTTAVVALSDSSLGVADLIDNIVSEKKTESDDIVKEQDNEESADVQTVNKANLITATANDNSVGATEVKETTSGILEMSGEYIWGNPDNPDVPITITGAGYVVHETFPITDAIFVTGDTTITIVGDVIMHTTLVMSQNVELKIISGNGQRTITRHDECPMQVLIYADHGTSLRINDPADGATEESRITFKGSQTVKYTSQPIIECAPAYNSDNPLAKDVFYSDANPHGQIRIGYTTFADSYFRNVQSMAVYVRGYKSQVYFQDVHFENLINTYPATGNNGVDAHTLAAVNFNDSVRVVSGTTDESLKDYNGKIIFKDCKFDNCTSNGYASAISFLGEVSGSTPLTNNDYTAVEGLENEFIIDNTTFNACTGGTYGGAVYLGNKIDHIEVANSKFTDCETVGAHGGAMYIASVCSNGLDINKVDFGGETATEGCIAKGAGGALYFTPASKFATANIIDCNFNNCVANANGGGAIRVDTSVYSDGTAGIGTFNVTGTTFKNCIANQNNGGALLVNTGSDAYEKAGIDTLNVDNSSFINCVAERPDRTDNTLVNTQGGSICFNNTDDGPEIKKVYISNSYFEGGWANTGGSISVMSTVETEFKVENTEFKDAEANANGGAIKLHTDSTNADFTFNKVLFNNCDSGYSGGGAIFLYQDAIINSIGINSCKFNGCDTAQSSGGAVGINGLVNGAVSITDEIAEADDESTKIDETAPTFYNCTAPLNGGAIIFGKGKSTVTWGSVGISGCKFSECTATNGGAINIDAADYTNGETTARMSDTEITDCIATSYGGAIYLGNAYSEIDITNSYIENNIALNGGGIAAVNGSNITMADSYVRYNEADYKDTPPTVSTTYNQSASLRGVGGGIFLADGVSGNASYFKYTGNNVYVYGNVADFAADDVFANANYTKLEIPATDNANLSGYTDANGNPIKVSGWFEDYADDDVQYKSKYLDIIGVTESRTPVRYRTVNSTYEVPVTSATSDNDANTANVFICMTWGDSSGQLDVKNFVTENSVTTEDDLNKDYTFRIVLVDDNGNESSINTTLNYIKTSDTTEESTVTQQISNGGTFTLKHGETARFVAVPVASYKIVEVLTSEEDFVISTDYKHRIENARVTIDGTEVSGIGEQADKVTVLTTLGGVDVEDRKSIVEFNNEFRVFTITLKYYQRKFVSGQPADMDENEVAFSDSYSKDGLLEFYNNGVLDTASMIAIAGVKLDSSTQSPDNILEGYHLWTTQSDAVNGISNKSVAELNRNYGEGTEYHTDQYGRMQLKNETDGKTYWIDSESNTLAEADGEKWVTYYDNDLAEKDMGITGVPTSEQSEQADSVTVWLFNQPKVYTVEYTAVADGTTSLEGIEYNDVSYTDNNGNAYQGYIITGESESTNAYYNQRLGDTKNETTGDDYNDTEMNDTTYLNHLEKYGLYAYTNNTVKTAETVGNLQFHYWAMDPEGKTVVSTDPYYNNRVTTDMTLYAVYGEGLYTGSGVTSIPNQVDKYYDTNGNLYYRLNTVMNPYGYSDFDPNISQVAVVYVNVKGMTLTDAHIQEIRKAIPQKLKEAKLSGTITNTDDAVVTVSVKYNGLVYDVQPANGDATSGKAELTNKNRIQISTTFSKAKIEGLHLYAFTAMNYAGEWKVSDNYADYDFSNSIQ